jgi:poly(3-hydroxybutyrate) depolymerase
MFTTAATPSAKMTQNEGDEPWKGWPGLQTLLKDERWRFYPPCNPDHAGSADERPPLLVKCHGGRTSSASSTLNLGTQFWTSRGIAVLDVNYGGSTGFGREYRERLKLNWGIVDVDDCVNGAKFLAQQGLVDLKRVVISGGSAGGYTALAALAFRDFFQGGASYCRDIQQPTPGTPNVPPNSPRNCCRPNRKACRVPPPLAWYRNAARTHNHTTVFARGSSVFNFDQTPIGRQAHASGNRDASELAPPHNTGQNR